VAEQASKSKWAQGASAQFRGALLGLLVERPGSGGELASRLIARLGETWRIEPKYIYRLLKQLEQEGFASGREQPRRGSEQGTSVIYHPTENTVAALQCWMDTLMPREPVRLGLQAKLAVARPQDAPRLLRALREYERECLMLAQLVLPTENQSPSWEGLRLDGTRDSVYGSLRADIDWSIRMRQRIAEYAARNP
jgi:DNA-binding PadR family transcriptional regulator